MKRSLIALGATLLGSIAGCTAAPGEPAGAEYRIGRYFAAFNDAADQGDQAQSEFLRKTQHPDFADQVCELNGLTVRAYPALSTLRPDPEWAPGDAEPPRGQVYVLAVSLTLRRAGTPLAEQIGSERVTILRDQVYGFAPCLSEE
ncbi:hypothetical protein [Amycolatopsis cihanbeyliensis]|uniref:hypothetical protein n=1 Tax=Amycolatopsis cihanbeyliensis TaxID=1128664 RepID=UPI0011525F0A|nr:hypothetical protein [Amycolatopsis cihanbeyliensis]